MRKKKEAVKRYVMERVHCTGICYWETSMCMFVDVCPVTRRKEFRGLIMAIATIIIFIAAAIAAIVLICRFVFM